MIREEELKLHDVGCVCCVRGFHHFESMDFFVRFDAGEMRPDKELRWMKNEGFDQLAFARRIRRAGRPIHIPEDDGEVRYIPSYALRIYQTGAIIESTAFDLGAGTGFKINLVVTSRVSGFAVSHIELQLPWEQALVQWLEDPKVIDGPSSCYHFFGNTTLEFDRNLVLNHRLQLTQRFSAGESAEGFLLGLGSEPIPEEYHHGKMIPAFVVIYDQFARMCQVTIQLWADRSTTRIRPTRSDTMLKGKLLDKRDPIVPYPILDPTSLSQSSPHQSLITVV